MTINRRVKLVAIGSGLLFAACVFYCMYTTAIHRPVRDTLVDDWLDIAFERRRLAGLDAATVLITSEEYELDSAKISRKEQSIVFNTEFLANKSELHSFLLSRETGNYYPVGLWVLLFGSVIAFTAAVSWLRGNEAGVKLPYTIFCSRR